MSIFMRRGRWWPGTVALVLTVIGTAYLTWGKDRRRSHHSPAVRSQSSALDADQESALLLERVKHEPLWADSGKDPPHDWAQYRGTHRDGVVRGVRLVPDWSARKPVTVWQTPCGGGYSSVAVAGGRAYLQDRPTGEDRERILCLDAASGKEVWARSFPADFSRVPGAGPDAGPLATPTVHGNRLYAVGALGRFVCLELDGAGGDPAVAWEHDLTKEFEVDLPVWGMASSPLIVGDLVVVQPGGRRGSVVAFDRVSGRLRWAALTEVNGYSSPVLAEPAGVRQVVTLTQGRLVALRPETGEYLWHYVWRESTSLPLVSGDYAFITCDHGCALVKVEPDGGALKAKRVFECGGKLLASHVSTPVVNDGYVYGFHGDVHGHPGAMLTCVDLRDPTEPRWQSETVTSGQVIRFADLLFVQSQDGDVFLVRATPDAFRQVGHVKGILNGDRAWAAPSAVGSRVFLRDDRKVVCLELPAEHGRTSQGTQ